MNTVAKYCSLTLPEIRGYARTAARNGLPVDRAYGAMRRAYDITTCVWSEFTDAYRSERATLVEER